MMQHALNVNPNERRDIPTRTLQELDDEFLQIGCLGTGSMGSVLIAERKSGRRVALKVLRIDNEDDAECFHRELDSIAHLQAPFSSDKHDSRDLSIIFFEKWFRGPNFAAIVMNHVEGPSLAQEIHSKKEPFTERRIAWYALQLSEALAYAHERGVTHYDVKSSNVFIDQKQGGKLVLGDFGSSVIMPHHATVVGFSELYASPELLEAHANDDYTGLDGEKVDAFGLGCILFELLCAQKLVDLTTSTQTLAEFVRDSGINAALDLPCITLPWLSDDSTATSLSPQVGYSNALRGLVKTLLEPDPNNRWTPGKLQKPLRNDPASPLVADHVAAAHPQTPGAPVTIDNIQLGMFVQRGQDWQEGDGENDGIDEGSIGVVVNLDADALYTVVAWPNTKQTCCRIGAGCKFELQVGPTPMNNFVTGNGEPMTHGILRNLNASDFSIGQVLNDNCVVVDIQGDRNLVFVAPRERIDIPTIAAPPLEPPSVPRCIPRKPRGPPVHWQESSDGTILVEVTDIDEKTGIIDKFHATQGGMDIQAFEITSIKRVQSTTLWKAYAVTRENVAAENWGMANEQQLFHGTGIKSPEPMLLGDDAIDFYQQCSYGAGDLTMQQVRFSTRASWAHDNGHRCLTGDRQVVLSRVALGRVKDFTVRNDLHTHKHEFQSEKKEWEENAQNGRIVSEILFSIRNPSQAFPEYVITYKSLQNVSSRRIVSSSRRASDREGGLASAVLLRLPRQLGSSASMNGGQHATVATTSPQTNTTTTSKSTATPTNSIVPHASPSKMCVVCLGKPVCRILLPCGHPCLCEVCSTEQGLAKLKRKCPECRKSIREAATIYGRVVND